MSVLAQAETGNGDGWDSWLRWQALFDEKMRMQGIIAPADEREGCTMLTTLNHLVGLPVVFQGEQIGQVERCVADKSSAYLQGLIIRQGLGGAKWVPSHLLETLGRRCVIIRGQPEAMPGRFAGEPKLLYLTNGQLAGEITDVVLADQSLRLVALEVSAGLLQRLTGQRQYATEYHIRRTGSRCGEAVASGLISWVEMNERLKEDGIT